MEDQPSKTSFTDDFNVAESTPEPRVALDCGSRSMSKTFLFILCKQAAKFMLVVVLPTPPFWLTIDNIFKCSLCNKPISIEKRRWDLASFQVEFFYTFFT